MSNKIRLVPVYYSSALLNARKNKVIDEMSSSILTVDQFVALINYMPPSVKEVFDYLQTFSNHKARVFPGLERIAEKTGYCQRQIKRATKWLADHGVMAKLRRAYRSNEYIIHEEFMHINVKDPDCTNLKNKYTSKKPPTSLGDVPINVPIEECIRSKEYIHVNTCASAQVLQEKRIRKKKENIIIPEFLKLECLKEWQRRRLAYNFSEYLLNKAIENAKWYEKTVEHIDNAFGYLWKAAKGFAKGSWKDPPPIKKGEKRWK